MNDEDIRPPGTDTDGKKIADKSRTLAFSSDLPGQNEPLIGAANTETAASAAASLAVASSSKAPSNVPTHIQPPLHNNPPPFYPPNMPPPMMPNRMRYPPPPMPMMRPGYGRPSYHGQGGPGSRFRPPHRSSVYSGGPRILKSDSKIVSDSTIQAKPQIRYENITYTKIDRFCYSNYIFIVTN